MHIAEVVTIAKSLPLLRLNTYKSLILSYSADYRRILQEKKTLKEAKKGMADKYDECIAELSVSDPLRASFLLDNKESLVVTGRDELTIDNL